MNLSHNINTLERLDQLIRLKATGNPQALAQKLGISVRAWYRLKKVLEEDLNVPLKYSNCYQSYVYVEPGRLVIKFLREGE